MGQVRLCSIIFLLSLANFSCADTVRAAVASNFTAAMTVLEQQFEERSGHELLISYGSSGKFVAQIQQGAPFDVFLSADQEKPRVLAKAGHVVEGSTFTYAVGQLVLWSAQTALFDDSPAPLLEGEFRKLAIANPKLAPYGSAAVEVLQDLGVYEAVKSKLVQGENISQTFQFVSTGNADMGFVALSQVMSEGELGSGSGWRVPMELHSPIKQDAALLSFASNKAAAKQFLEFLRGEQARGVIRSFGYRQE